jgi:hypothetical protein
MRLFELLGAQANVYVASRHGMLQVAIRRALQRIHCLTYTGLTVPYPINQLYANRVLR